jgi:hypothetical protein
MRPYRTHALIPGVRASRPQGRLAAFARRLLKSR